MLQHDEDIEDIVLCEVNQQQKAKYCMILLHKESTAVKRWSPGPWGRVGRKRRIFT
jgi:hypothetical protein